MFLCECLWPVLLYLVRLSGAGVSVCAQLLLVCPCVSLLTVCRLLPFYCLSALALVHLCLAATCCKCVHCVPLFWQCSVCLLLLPVSICIWPVGPFVSIFLCILSELYVCFLYMSVVCSTVCLSVACLRAYVLLNVSVCLSATCMSLCALLLVVRTCLQSACPCVVICYLSDHVSLSAA